jgi:LAO/AO transport system kinase
MCDLADRLLKGDRVALAKAITCVENQSQEGEDILRDVFGKSGRAFHIGVTGPPGAGKSTLVDRITSRILHLGKTAGIIAVDPTSPFSGGALLGDRIRMNDLASRKGAFIRSMATRGSLGGLSATAKDVSVLLDAFGKDYVIMETIGVGQVELDIADACDTTVVVLVPESGDAIQAMKAGLMEIADITVINKADRQGGEQLKHELEFISQLRAHRSSWSYPIQMTEATNDTGIDDLWNAIQAHSQYMQESGELLLNRKRQMRARVRELLESKIMEYVENRFLSGNDLDAKIESVMRREVSPFEAADDLFTQIRCSRIDRPSGQPSPEG